MSEESPNYGSHSGSPLGAASGYAPFALEPSQSSDLPGLLGLSVAGDCGASSRTLRVLNLYAGVGGNRKLWRDVEVTAVENEPKIAAVYQRLHPNDKVVVGDAHAYLLANYADFDFIWSSPPCQTHSKMAKATRHKLKRYPDMSLYQQVIFLRTYAKCPWVVENVVPYYTPLITPTRQIGRHLFWSNFAFVAQDVARPSDFINRCNVAGKEAIQEWLGIHYPENIYYGSNHCPAQILRNCVHPLLGEQIFKAARRYDSAQAGLPGSSGSSKADEQTNTEHNGAQEHNRVITEGQWNVLQERKCKAKEGGYVIDDYTQ